MSNFKVTYRVKPQAAAENEALIAQVYEELHRTNPADLHFATFVADDGLRFVHMASSDDDGPSPLTELTAFQAFRVGLVERCAEPMTLTERREIGGARSAARSPRLPFPTQAGGPDAPGRSTRLRSLNLLDKGAI